MAGERQQLADVHALVAHPLDAHDHVQQRGDEPQVAGHRSLAGEQRQQALVDLEVAPVDAVVVGDHDRGQLDVLMGERLERAVELLEHDVDAAERALLELAELLVEARAAAPARGLLGGWHVPRLLSALASSRSPQRYRVAACGRRELPAACSSLPEHAPSWGSRRGA